MNTICVSALCKSFDQKHLFQNYSRDFCGPTVLMAPSGRGKTTLLRMMMGLELPDSGTISGVGRVSAVFQEDRLCPQLNATGNLRLVNPALTPAQLTEAFEALELRGQDLTTPAARLSGGQKRRVALLRALLAPADTLLLDEPFSGMDAALAQKALALIRQSAQGKTAILVTHDLAVAGWLGWPVVEL